MLQRGQKIKKKHVRKTNMAKSSGTRSASSRTQSTSSRTQSAEKKTKKSSRTNPLRRLGNTVTEPLRNAGNRLASLVPNALSPFTQDTLSAIRMQILTQMKRRGFKYYANLLDDVRSRINYVISRDNLVLEDDLWNSSTHWRKKSKKGTPVFGNKPLPWWTGPDSMFWTNESPELKANFFDRSDGFVGWALGTSGRRLGVKRILATELNEKYVDKLVGNVNWMSLSQKTLFAMVLSSYFKNEDTMWPVACNMDFAYRNLVKNALGHSNVKLALLTAGLGGAGPFVLKILQQLQANAEEKEAQGRVNNQKVGDSDLEHAAGSVLTQVPALTEAEFQVVLGELRNDPAVGSFARRMFYQNGPLGSASLAVAYPVKNREGARGGPPPESADTVAVMKFLKPMYAYYYLCEVDFFLRKGWKDIKTRVYGKKSVVPRRLRKTVLIKARKLLLFFLKAFAEEFNYKQEARFTQMGTKYYNRPKDKIRTVKLIAVTTTPFSAIVTELAQGRSLKAWVDLFKKERGERRLTGLAVLYSSVSNLYKLWLRTVLFGSGFFHADLHAGNILLTIDGVVWVIDFGSAGRLKSSQQNGLLKAIVTSSFFKQPSWPDVLFVNKFLGNRAFANLQQKNKFDGIVSQIQTYHRSNVSVGLRFVDQISKLCEVKLDKTERVRIVNAILKYSKGLFFTSLFLDFAQESYDVGSCIAGDVLLFGRGTAYLSTAIVQIVNLCNDKAKCPEFLLTDALPTALHQLPLRLLRIGVSAGIPAWFVRRGKLKLGKKYPTALDDQQIRNGRIIQSRVRLATTGNSALPRSYPNGVRRAKPVGADVERKNATQGAIIRAQARTGP